jgi:hypothetical protein
MNIIEKRRRKAWAHATMVINECREADCAHWLGRNLGCEYPDLDGCRISPSNCPEYISCEDYQEQEEFYE